MVARAIQSKIIEVRDIYTHSCTLAGIQTNCIAAAAVSLESTCTSSPVHDIRACLHTKTIIINAESKNKKAILHKETTAATIPMYSNHYITKQEYRPNPTPIIKKLFLSASSILQHYL